MAFGANKQGHRWKFNRLGGFDQVVIESGEDICQLPDLDQKLWATLSCPTTGVEFDAHTLQLLDSDGDGRIRVPEVLAAVSWTCRFLKDPNDLLQHPEALPLSAIDDSNDDGRQLLASAQRILEAVGKQGAEVITAEDTADTKRIFTGTRFNGDGVVPPASAEDEGLAKAIEDIMACVGAAPDRSGSDGLSQALCDKFFEEASDYLDWWAEAEADAASILPLGEATEQAAMSFEAVKGKVDDYFTRARLAAYDARASEFLNPSEADYTALALKTLSSTTDELSAFPVARVAPGRSLPLGAALNPRWSGEVAAFRDQVAVPLLGDVDALSEDQWTDISNRFAAHSAWRAKRRGAAVAPLGLERLKDLVSGTSKADVDALIAQDKALEGTMNAIESVDRLLHYYRHLDTLLHNFVSLREFYTPGRKAVFQAGTLYLDGRSCELCVRVGDIAAHSSMAALSQTYLAYCMCRRRGGEETMTIAAAFTDGDADNLMIGRNGVFYDRTGADWDATIVKLIEHAISVRQAFWSPYKRIGRMVTQQIAKFAGARDKSVEEGSAKGIADVAAKAQSGKAEAAPFDIAKFAGIFAAIGLAVGAIGTALAAVLAGFLSLVWWQMPLAFVGIMLLISGPSMLMAYMNLRQRNLGPMLDANGWAVNTLAKINIPFGGTLTGTAELPTGAVRSMRDPFAEKKRPWKTYLFLIALIAGFAFLWREGHLNAWWTKIQDKVQFAEPTSVQPARTEPESGTSPSVSRGAAPASIEPEPKPREPAPVSEEPAPEKPAAASK